MLLNCGVGEDSWKSLGQQGVSTSQSYEQNPMNREAWWLQAIVSQSRTWLKWQHACTRKVKFTHQSGPSDFSLGSLHSSPHTTVRVILLNESSHEPTLQNILILFHLKQGNPQSFYRQHNPELPFWISLSTISPSFSTTLKKTNTQRNS